MQRLFNQIGETEPNGSPEFLIHQQTRLRDKKACGFIELELSEARQAILLYAHGSLAGAYLVENGESRPIHLANLDGIWNGSPISIRVASVSDLAGRVAWLALESSSRDKLQVQNEADLEREIQQSAEYFLGLIELASEEGHGFAVIRKGEYLPLESALLDPQGSEKGFLAAFGASQHWVSAVYEVPSSANAYACFALRQGALRWSNAVLTRFQNLSGAKFLRALTQVLETIIEPWQWNIFVNESTLTDAHFFPNSEATAHAYRAIFMTIGAQMGFVIGNLLARRILGEMFAQLPREERAALESHRLIPAAFSE